MTASTMAAPIMDILGLSLTGILVVMIGLALLAVAVSLFKFFIPNGKKEEDRQPTPTGAPEIAAEKIGQLDNDQLAAITTALTIEWRLYHEDKNSEPAFDYDGEKLSNWIMSSHLNK